MGAELEALANCARLPNVAFLGSMLVCREALGQEVTCAFRENPFPVVKLTAAVVSTQQCGLSSDMGRQLLLPCKLQQCSQENSPHYSIPASFLSTWGL